MVKEGFRSMGRKIWCKLPEDLTERVFAFLPISQVFRCRLVCREWNSILTSQRFMELWTELSPPNPWFLLYKTPVLVVAYDPASRSWTNIPLYHRCSLDSDHVQLMASDGGLLCFWNGFSQYETLIVCNPLTKSRRVLPQMLRIRNIEIVGMVADKPTNSYRILVTGTTEMATDGFMTEIYDSRLGKWIHQCDSRREFEELCGDSPAMWHKGVFYTLALMDDSKRLLANDMERREWTDMNVEMPSDRIWCASLITCGGRLLLVGENAEHVEGRRNVSICIWELRMDSLQWVMVDVMPRQVLSETSINILGFQGNNNLICCTKRPAPQSFVYDLSDRRWRFLPKNRAYRKMMGRKTPLGMSYEPNLAAKP